MTMLDSVTVQCGLCGTEAVFSLILSTSSIGSSDLDTRSPAMNRWVLESQVQRCPGCGYCASDVGVVSPDAPGVIKGQEYRDQLTDPSYPDLANSFLCKAILDRESKNFSEATWAFMMAAWVCDDADDVWQAIACRNKAVDTLMLAEIHKQHISKQEEMNVAILVDLLRRSKQVEQARKIIAARRGRITDDLIKRMLAYQADLLDKNDFSCHTIAEARSHIRKHAPAVVATRALDQALQAQQRSSDKVQPMPGDSSKGVDATKSSEREANLAPLPKAFIGLKEDLSLLLILTIIAVGGVGVGNILFNKGPWIVQLLSFVFTITGGFALAAALVLAVLSARAYIPVLIEDSPAPIRPLFALVIITMWASIPLWPYYLNNPLIFNLEELIQYFVSHGVFVGQLFIVGIVAFLYGRNSTLTGYKKIQLYVLNPVVCLFVAAWLSPEHDPAVEVTGLNEGLVYYVGILVAASLGLFAGTVSVRANDDLSLFISKYGQPDQIKLSEHENPRPPIVSKQLIYEKENVRVVYLADAPIGSPPPYKGWKFFGFQDQRTNAVLKADEVGRRLEKRIKK